MLTHTREKVMVHTVNVELVAVRIYRDIQQNIAAGRIPSTVNRFSQLYAFVDPELYGPAQKLIGAYGYPKAMDIIAAARVLVDGWLNDPDSVPIEVR